jgi:hypothetical protein
MKRLSAALLALFLTASVVRADVPAPPAPHKPGDPVPFVIVVDDKAAPAKLTVPKELIGAMRAALDNADGNSYASAATPTVAAGLSLSLALAFGGVWLMRSRAGQGGKHLAILVGAVALFAVTGVSVFADKAPGGGKRPLLPASELIVVTIVDKEAGPITLTVTKDKLTKSLEAAAKPDPK